MKLDQIDKHRRHCCGTSGRHARNPHGGIFVTCIVIGVINVDKTKVMASDGIAYRILIQNELLKQVDTFPYLGSLITKDGECTTEFRTRLNRGHAIRASLQ